MSEQRSWSDALDLQLARRLIRPMVQPGVIDARMARVIIARSQSLNNRLPLLTQLQRRGVTATSLQPGQIPIVYAQLLPREAEEVGGTKAAKPPVVQPKFARPSNSSVGKILPVEPSLPIIQNSNFSVPQIQRKIDGNQTPIDASRGASANPTDNSSISPSPSKLPIVQAKFDAADTPSLSNLSLPVVPTPGISTAQLPKKQQEKKVYGLSNDVSAPPISPVRNLFPFDLPTPEIPIVYAQLLGENSQRSAPPVNQLPVVKITPNLNSLSPHQSDPLVFSLSSANTLQQTSAINPKRIETNPYQVALRQGNQIADKLPINRATEQTHETTVIQNTTTNSSQPITGIHRNHTINPKTHPQQTIDLDALADKVERKLMRRLVVESERRGQKQWR